MKRAVWYRTVCVLASGWLMMACYGQSGTTLGELPAAEAAVEEVSIPDPGPEEARQVEEFVRLWVAERVGEGDTYNIPPRAGQDVAGTLAGFHTVHQKDADTYYVCVDFEDSESTYDVDFFIHRTAEGLSVSDHYLHKVAGADVE